MTSKSQIAFNNSYAQLPERFYSRQLPIPVSAPALVRVNEALAHQLGIDSQWLASDSGVQMLAGNEIPAGADPISVAYAGHQFGSFNPQLGDGRASLLGEVLDRDQQRYDIQLKGSGPTTYSRGGDGRSPLGPVIREYIVSEAMFALGIPTTRSLAAVITGDTVAREVETPGGILTRVAKSHIRIGTVEFFAARQDNEALHLLIEHVIERHYPEAAEAENPALRMYELIMAKLARLVASWQLLGFIHGVMNTDNILLSGETIDYGPCAFMDSFHPDKVFSSIDQSGRYAYSNQPGIMHWNLSCLAQGILSLFSDDQDKAVETAQQALNRFPKLYESEYQLGLSKKLGLSRSRVEDDELIQDLMKLMKDEELDYTLTFRLLADLVGENSEAGISQHFELPDALMPWVSRWREHIASDPMDPSQRQTSMYEANPAYIPRNHLVEEAIQAANQQEYSAFHAMVDALSQPYQYLPGNRRFATPPRPEEVVRKTFCGT